MDVITQTVRVEQTRNSKYQKADASDVSQAIYSLGLRNCPDLVGKNVTVTIEVID